VVTFPDDWSSARSSAASRSRRPDDEIYLWFELIAPADMPAVQKEHDRYFAKEGVTVTGSSETVKSEVNGKAWSFTELKAKSEDGPSIIRYVAINPNVASGKIILMTYWASMTATRHMTPPCPSSSRASLQIAGPSGGLSRIEEPFAPWGRCPSIFCSNGVFQCVRLLCGCLACRFR
jgi:hypothetical protein